MTYEQAEHNVKFTEIYCISPRGNSRIVFKIRRIDL
jgi:hypothetical protein